VDLELTPPQPPEVAEVLAGLLEAGLLEAGLLEAQPGGRDPWWQAGIEDALEDSTAA